MIGFICSTFSGWFVFTDTASGSTKMIRGSNINYIEKLSLGDDKYRLVITAYNPQGFMIDIDDCTEEACNHIISVAINSSSV